MAYYQNRLYPAQSPVPPSAVSNSANPNSPFVPTAQFQGPHKQNHGGGFDPREAVAKLGTPFSQIQPQTPASSGTHNPNQLVLPQATPRPFQQQYLPPPQSAPGPFQQTHSPFQQNAWQPAPQGGSYDPNRPTVGSPNNWQQRFSQNQQAGFVAPTRPTQSPYQQPVLAPFRQNPSPYPPPPNQYPPRYPTY